MNYLLFGLLFCGIFGIIFLGLLQYIFLTWQDKRLRGERIAKEMPKIPTFKNIWQSFGFIPQLWSKIISNLTARNRPQKLANIVLKIEKIRQNIWQKLQKFFRYLQTLAKPKKTDLFDDNFDQLHEFDISKSNLEDDLDDFGSFYKKENIEDSLKKSQIKVSTKNSSFVNNDDLSTKNLRDISENPSKITNKIVANSQNLHHNNFSDSTSSKVSFSNQNKTPKADDIWGNLNSFRKLENEDESYKINLKDSYKNDDLENSNTATIGLIGNSSAKSDDDLTLFERAEKKLIQKLQELGLNHWDLWLELGDLYGKYDQKAKQKEIYTLILSKADGKEKELATYRLIGMN